MDKNISLNYFFKKLLSIKSACHETQRQEKMSNLSKRI